MKKLHPSQVTKAIVANRRRMTAKTRAHARKIIAQARAPKPSRGLPWNIEKSATRAGEYVGYCTGAQRIRKGGQGWETYGLGSASGSPVYETAPTLSALGAKLEARNR